MNATEKTDLRMSLAEIAAHLPQINFDWEHCSGGCPSSLSRRPDPADAEDWDSYVTPRRVRAVMARMVPIQGGYHIEPHGPSWCCADHPDERVNRMLCACEVVMEEAFSRHCRAKNYRESEVADVRFSATWESNEEAAVN